MKFDGVAALVTGAASGMGRATVDALSAAGARVALLDVDARGVEKAARETGGKAFPCDMQDPGQVELAIGEAIATFGALRIVVSCAGIGRMEPIVGPGAVPFSQLAHTLRVNLLGTLHVLQLVATDLVRREPVDEGERGVMIMVASGAAFDGPVQSAAYTASKGGIVSMTLALARELGDHGIRVNTISPGGFATAMIRNAPEELTALIPAITPFPKRMGRPPEFADLALHICSNRFLNGAVIRLDGANRMPYYSTSALGRDGASV
jgi:NAD(P)-dependent dehydrogenase (short-subunit alcohol dehydrogenase family)